MARRGWRSLGKRGGEARAIVPRVLPRRVVGKVGLHLGARECELVSRAHAGDLHDGASVRPAVEVAVVEGEELGRELELDRPLPRAPPPPHHPLPVEPDGVRLGVDLQALLRELQVGLARLLERVLLGRVGDIGIHALQHLATKIPHRRQVAVLKHNPRDHVQGLLVVQSRLSPFEGGLASRAVRSGLLLTLLAFGEAVFLGEPLHAVHGGRRPGCDGSHNRARPRVGSGSVVGSPIRVGPFFVLYERAPCHARASRRPSATGVRHAAKPASPVATRGEGTVSCN